MDQTLETEGELRTATGAAARMKLWQMIEYVPEQLLGQERVALAVGVRERVLAGRRGGANCRQGTGVQAQRITDVVEAEGMSELGVEQTHDMTPRTKRPCVGVHPGVAGQLRHEMVGNEIAELAQESETAARWLAGGLVLHGLLCGRSNRFKPTSISPHHQKSTKPMGLQ